MEVASRSWFRVAVAAFLPLTAGSGQTSSDAWEEAVVFAVLTTMAAHHTTIRVEPRLLRDGVDLAGIDHSDLGAASDATLAAAAKGGYPLTDILADKRCMFAHGTPHPPEVAGLAAVDAQRRRECSHLRDGASIALGRPILHSSGEVVVRTVQMTTSRYAVQELAVTSTASGVWEVTGVTVVLDVRS